MTLGPAHLGIAPLDGRSVRMPRVEASFLCADVVSFTAMTERLGDTLCLNTMRRASRVVDSNAEAHDGRAIEVRGDLFLLAFPEPQLAIDCATGIVRELSRGPQLGTTGRVHLRMSIHAGSVLALDQHYFGLNVILPFRLLPLAGVDQIAVSDSTIDGMPQRELPPVLGHRVFRPKGFSESVAFTLLDATRRPAPSTVGPVARTLSRGSVDAA